jgi:hypothetical protein
MLNSPARADLPKAPIQLPLGFHRRGYQVRLVEQPDLVALQLFHGQWLVGEVKGVPLSTATFWLHDIAIANQVQRSRRSGWVKWWPLGGNEWPQPINYRGRGLGTILLRSLIAYTQARGFQDIQGQVFQADLENTPYLLRWYQQQGFQLLAVSEHDPPELVANLWMNLISAEAKAVPPSDTSSSAG